MKTEWKFLAFSGAFGLAIGAIYWFVSYEEAGTLFLLLMGAAAAFVGAYILYSARGRSRPEDDAEAEYGDEAGTRIGYFNAGSIWPFVMGVGVVVAMQGFVYGRWLLFVGVVVFVVAALGMMRESQG